MLSFSLAKRVRGFGILVKTIGTAAVDRLRPLFKEFGDQDQAKAFIALVMQIASAVAKNGQSPDIIFPNTNDSLAGAGVGKSNNGHNGSVRQKIQQTPQSRNPQSLAGN